jgi:hypothetical protein
MIEVSILNIFDEYFLRSFSGLFEANEVIAKILAGNKG